MKQEDIEKAWNLLSMHNSELLLERAELLERLRNQSSELLLERAELLERLRNQSIWLILKYRVKHYIKWRWHIKKTL